MAKPEVLVTGLGVVYPGGAGVDDFWSFVLEGTRLPAEDAAAPPGSMRVRHTYAVAELPPVDDALTAGSFGGRASRLGRIAAEMALADAGLPQGQGAEGPIGLILGSAMGDDVFERERTSGRPVRGPESFPFMTSGAVASTLGLEGPNLTVSTACSAGLYAIALGAEMIEAGEAEVMLVGGAEAVCRVAMGCFNRLMAIDPSRCRPFDRARQGTVMGEGAAVLVLESAEHADRRAWRGRYAAVLGAGWSCDAHHATIPDPSGQGALSAARRALAEADLGPEAIACVVAHGTGTEQNDVVEGEMLRVILGQRLGEVPVTAIKSKLGHGGGAAGAFQGLTAALALRHRLLPPTQNLEEVDPRCTIWLPTAAVALGDGCALLNSYAFGGNNVSIVMGPVS